MVDKKMNRIVLVGIMGIVWINLHITKDKNVKKLLKELQAKELIKKCDHFMLCCCQK